MATLHVQHSRSGSLDMRARVSNPGAQAQDRAVVTGQSCSLHRDVRDANESCGCSVLDQSGLHGEERTGPHRPGTQSTQTQE